MKKPRTVQTILIVSALALVTSCGAVKTSGGSMAPAAPSEAQPASITSFVSETPSAAEQTKVALYPAALDICTGKSLMLAADIEGYEAGEWTSSNTESVTVDQNGTVKAQSTGEALVSVSSGGSSAACRVTVRDSGMTLAYQEDPGALNGDGTREQTENDNFPVVIPDDQTAVEKALFEDAEYAWEFIIDDGFDTNLKVPGTGISYIGNYHIVLDAHKTGGDTVMGDYEGTMKMEMAIDKESFIAAMKAQDIPVTDMSSAMQTQDVTVRFKVVTYDLDKINDAKYAFAPSGTVPVIPLVQIPAMAISSADTSTTGSVNIEAESGYGSGNIAGAAGQITYVIEVKGNGTATLYLPNMLALCDNNIFNGILVRMRLLDLP